MPATTPKPKPFPEIEENGAKEKSNGYNKPTYVRCDLSNEQKKEMAEWANSRNADDLLNYINDAVEKEYTMSVKRTDKGYQASLTKQGQLAVHNRNGGKSLVTRASTCERSLWSLYYKHREIMSEDWSKGNEEYELEW